MEGFKGAEVPPRGGQAILEELPTALARGLEELDVASKPGLERKERKRGGGFLEEGEGFISKPSALPLFPHLQLQIQSDQGQYDS